MTTIRNAQFEFELDLTGERASSISTRAMELLEGRLAAEPERSDTIETMNAGMVEISAGADIENAAQQIASAVYAGIGRSRRG